jgi:hypothetical protein
MYGEVVLGEVVLGEVVLGEVVLKVLDSLGQTGDTRIHNILLFIPIFI